MKFIERIKYAYSKENIKSCFHEYPVLAPLALACDVCLAGLIIAAILWGVGVIG